MLSIYNVMSLLVLLFAIASIVTVILFVYAIRSGVVGAYREQQHRRRVQLSRVSDELHFLANLLGLDRLESRHLDEADLEKELEKLAIVRVNVQDMDERGREYLRGAVMLYTDLNKFSELREPPSLGVMGGYVGKEMKHHEKYLNSFLLQTFHLLTKKGVRLELGSLRKGGDLRSGSHETGL